MCATLLVLYQYDHAPSTAQLSTESARIDQSNEKREDNNKKQRIGFMGEFPK